MLSTIDTSSIQTSEKQLAPVTFNSHTFDLKGTLKNPLFPSNEVLIKVLEYKESNHNLFYRKNKENEKYFVLIGKRYFMTEKGFYETLF